MPQQKISANAEYSLEKLVEENSSLDNKKDAFDFALVKAGLFKVIPSKKGDSNE